MKYPKTFGRPEAVWNKLGGEEGVDRFLRGELVVAEKSPRLLFVDRAIKPTYPDFVEKVLHPELELSGPSYLDPACAPLYLHPKQENGGVIGGNKLYDFYKETGLIKLCWSLRDGEELRKNPHLFPESWKGRYIFLWKSVVQNRGGHLDVPFVYWDDGQVCIGWRWLDYDWHGSNPAALSAS